MSPRLFRSRPRRRWVAAGLAVATAATGIAIAVTLAPQASAAVLPNGFKSVGYMPSWAGSVNAVQYNKLTHINYSFVLPNSNGTLQAAQPSKLSSLVSLAHANNVRVSIAVGGWNDGDSGFEALAANAEPYHVRQQPGQPRQPVRPRWCGHGLGVPGPGTSGSNFTLLMQELSNAMHSRGKLLTAAVVSGGTTANGVQTAVFGMVDWLNIMAYDGGSPHANYDWAIAAANGWKARGLPASKTVLGVPFYSRPGGIAYSQIVAMNANNANVDCVTISGAQQYYNGLPTIRRKTQWAMANGGIMYWELSQDTTGSTSLVNAIYEVATGGNPPPPPPPRRRHRRARVGQITGIAGKCVDISANSTANGAAIQLWTCNGTTAQRWTVGTDGTIRANGKCMDVAAAGTANGTVIQLWDCNGTGAQVWQAQANGNLRNPNSAKCLDATGMSSADGTRLQIWTCATSANQIWRLP